MPGSPVPLEPWQPLSVAAAADVFSATTAPWWLAGGYAIELAVGRPFRPHDDIDILLLRPDQLTVQAVLPDWEWLAADPPGTLRPWRSGEILPPDVHDIWCRPGPEEAWQLQVMLDEADGSDWVSRRSPEVRRPVSDIGLVSDAGVPYLRPEIQLFYKGRQIRPKDEQDFQAALPVLTTAALRWLRAAVVAVYGPDHRWLDRVTAQLGG